MPQDIEKKHQFAHEQAAHKQAREQDAADTELNDAVLQADSHTGQAGILPTSDDMIEASEIKAAYGLLPGWHKDELRRLLVVAPGTRLLQGSVYCDLRFPQRGELVAHGEEEIHEELFVPKKGTDYEIWNKLLATGSISPQ